MENHRNSPLGVISFTIAVGTLLLICGILLSGCGAEFFSARTKATYQVTKDGKLIVYDSSKEQNGLEVDLTEDPSGHVQNLKIHVDKANTSTDAIAAALSSTNALIQSLIPLIQQAIKAGAAAGAGT